MDNQLQYYGLDWLAMILTFFAIVQIGNKRQIGFVLAMSGNVIWVSVGFLTESIAIIIANVVFLSMNFRANFKWAQKDDSVPVDTSP